MFNRGQLVKIGFVDPGFNINLYYFGNVWNVRNIKTRSLVRITENKKT